MLTPDASEAARSSRRVRRGPIVAVLLAAVVAAGGAGGYLLFAPSHLEVNPQRTGAVPACDVPIEILQRVKRGYVPGRSGDVLTIERFPNLYGNRHSTPFPYTQEVPLVLYGPGFIKKGFVSNRDVTLADIAPTFAELLDFDDFPKRGGKSLTDALLAGTKRNGVPKLIFTLVWDGGGDDALERWPNAWPELERLQSEGARYTNATAGSSPSNTPPVHATIGTGAFPQTHGIPDTMIRVHGEVHDPWEHASPRYLRSKTLADLWDAANGNRPLIGLLARDAWHLGMMGHGVYLPEGDRDIAVLDDLGDVAFRDEDGFYEFPPYIDLDGLNEAIAEVDKRDGQADQRWLGNALVPIDGRIRSTPVWSILQTQKLVQILENEGFGADDVPDLFYTNYKGTDLAGHEWNMVEPEVRDVLKEQDAQIPLIIDALDRLVGRRNYVLALTADHGMAPYPEVLGGWPINTQVVTADIERAFDKTTPERHLVLSNRGYQIMLDHKEMKRNGVTASEIARWIRAYRLGDNVPKGEQIDERYERHESERLYTAALTPRALKAALACARERA